ncbi:MAG: mechanosensitive ion channel domain-containing protein [Cyanobacteria bacterium J06560_5]
MLDSTPLVPARSTVFFQPRRALILGCVATVLSVWMILGIPTAGWAQTASSPRPTAKVVIDGRVLFRLGSISGFTAERRAESANQDLQVAIQTTPLDQLIRIHVVERDQLTTIRLNNRHLLTVTESDFLMGVTHQEQAEDWAKILREALRKAQQERLPSHRQTVFWKSVVALLGAIALNTLLFRLRKQLRRRGSKRPNRPGQRTIPKRWIQPTLLGLQGAIAVAFFMYVCELLPRARIVRYSLFQFLENAFSSPLLTAGEQSYSLLDITRLIVLVLVLWLAVRGLTALVKARFLQVAIPDRGVQDAIATLMQFTLMTLGMFILLQASGIDLSALAIFASVLGVGLGFGLQNIANNFISGWILLIERPVQVGDLINLGDVFGNVERIGARSTEIKTVDGVAIIIPNSELVQNRVTNWSHGHPVSRVHLPLSAAYDSEIDRVHTAAIEAAYAHPEVLRYPPPQLRFSEFGDSALHFDLLLWIRDPRHQFDIKSDVYYLLEANFKRYQIQIPFPQRDLHLRTPESRELLKQKLNTASLSNLPINTMPMSTMQTGASTAPSPATSPDSSPQGFSPQDLIKDSQPPSVPPSVTPSPKLGAFPASLLADVMKYSAILKTPKNVATTEVDRLVEQMLGPDGLEIRDRKFRLTTYATCFIGSEAVTWMVKSQKATRAEAVRLGQLLVERGIIHHVIDEHNFKDEYLFYRFYSDEIQQRSH